MVVQQPHNSGEWRRAVDFIGIDVHKKESQVCILATVRTMFRIGKKGPCMQRPSGLSSVGSRRPVRLSPLHEPPILGALDDS